MALSVFIPLCCISLFVSLFNLANRSGNGALAYSADLMTEGSEATLSAALMASQSAAHSAAQAVQAVAAATARGVGTQLARASVNSGKASTIPNFAQTTAVCARAVVAANHAAHAATVAARVISSAIGRLGKSPVTIYEDISVGYINQCYLLLVRMHLSFVSCICDINT